LKLREVRKCTSGKKWHVDATYIKVQGRWCYLYRAIDKQEDLVDVYLSDVRDQRAAEKFFKQAQKTTGITPKQITTDKEKALYPAIKNVFSDNTNHRDCKNNCLEQDHRGIKSRYKVMKGFKDMICALAFCTVFEEIKQFFRMAHKTRAERRSIIASKFQQFNNLAIQNS
jgi:putative transposase